ncbi:MAG: sucrase ferredoxin [Sandaracinaceae bacterium]
MSATPQGETPPRPASLGLEPGRCARAATEVAEPLAGTAPESTRVWILLEHPGPWGARPLQDDTLPEAVRDRLVTWQKDVAGARVQLIRRPGADGGSPRFLFGSSEPGEAWLAETFLYAYDELCSFDLPAALRRREVDGSRPRTAPLHLVCAHGKRDACCALLGTRTFRAMHDLAPDAVWQTSHTGGHRFAANVVSLPDGIAYGQVEPADARALLEAHHGGRFFDLARVRGRTAYRQPTQAAEVRVRQARDDLDLGSLTLHESRREDDGSWAVSFRDQAGAVHATSVRPTTLDGERPKSCGDAPSAVTAWVAR